MSSGRRATNPRISRKCIGLAKPRTVTPAALGEWAGEGLTLRLIDHGAFLEVSSYGAQRIRFDRVSDTAPPAQRGLTAPPKRDSSPGAS